MSLADKVKDKLGGVIDPETGMSVVEMELIRDLTATESGEVRLKFRPSSFLCHLAFPLALDIWQKVKEVEGIKDVHLQVVDCLWANQINELLEEGESEPQKGRE